MKAQDLKKGQIYNDIVDLSIPLMFTGKIKKQFDCITAYFTPVKTEKNKNWYNTIKIITINFDYEYGNTRIK